MPWYGNVIYQWSLQVNLSNDFTVRGFRFDMLVREVIQNGVIAVCGIVVLRAKVYFLTLFIRFN